jgi:Mg-chelatase subunit ChlD
MDTPPPVSAAASAPEPPASAAVAEAAPSQPAPTPPAPSPLDALKQRIADSGKNCESLSKMLKQEPLLQGSGSEASALKQRIMRSLEQNCRETAIREAKNLCPGQRPKELAPEMVIVFDASGSMNYSLDVTEAQIRQSGEAAAVENLMRQFLGGRATGTNPMLEKLTREPKRITVAKRATVSVAQRLPSDMNVGLVMVDQCPSARPVGFFGPGQRGSLIGQIQGIEPRAGTPLADGIAKGGQMVDGVKRESLMLVVSDGTESCGGDPCAVASALKQAKPHLRINVVDITGTGAGNCVAQATGGKVFTANNADQLSAMTSRAAQEAMGPANCKQP